MYKHFAAIGLLTLFAVPLFVQAQTNTSPATGSLQNCPVIARVLTLGSTGADVSALQEFLAADSDIYPEGQVTGYFGSLTEAAVKRWQAKYGIVSAGDANTTGWGLVGPRTRALMQERCLSGTSAPSSNTNTAPSSSATPQADIKANGSGGSLSVASGASPLLSWTSSNAQRCTLRNGQTGKVSDVQTSSSGYTYPITQAITYTLTCTAADGRTASDAVTITPREDTSTNSSSFSAAPISGAAPLAVAFQYTGTRGNSYFIDFGDGTNPPQPTEPPCPGAPGVGCSSTYQQVQQTHTYTSAGIYTAKLLGVCVGDSFACSALPNNGRPVLGTVTITVGGSSAATPQADIKANGSGGSLSVASGASPLLSWTSTNAQKCTLRNGQTGKVSDVQTSSSGYTYPITQAITYTLTCTATDGRTASDAVTITPRVETTNPSSCPNRIQLLCATGYHVEQDPADSNGCQGAARCVIDNTLSPSAGPQADIKADGSGGSLSVASGASPLLSWTSSNAQKCTLRNGVTGKVSDVQTSSSGYTYPITQAITYTLTCTATDGRTASDAVTITPREGDTSTNSSSFSASPISGAAPLVVTASFNMSTPCTGYGLEWGDGGVDNRVSGIGGCAAVIDNVQKTHTYTSAGIYTAKLSGECVGDSFACSTLPNNGRPVLGTVTITVGGSSAAGPQADIKANGSGGSLSVASGASPLLSWTSSNAQKCTLRNGQTGKVSDVQTSSSGYTYPITQENTYTLTCTAADGRTASDAVTITPREGETTWPNCPVQSAPQASECNGTWQATSYTSSSGCTLKDWTCVPTTTTYPNTSSCPPVPVVECNLAGYTFIRGGYDSLGCPLRDQCVQNTQNSGGTMNTYPSGSINALFTGFGAAAASLADGWVGMFVSVWDFVSGR